MVDLEDLQTNLDSLTKDKWNELFEFIPQLQKRPESYGEMVFNKVDKNIFNFPYVDYDRIVNDVTRKLYDLDLVPMFDYNSWEDWEKVKNSDLLSVKEVCKLFTVMIRVDRFQEGFMLKWFEDGTVLKLLKILQLEYGK